MQCVKGLPLVCVCVCCAVHGASDVIRDSSH